MDASAPQSGFVWDEASGYYYDSASQFYYDGHTDIVLIVSCLIVLNHIVTAKYVFEFNVCA